uniref:Nas2_N domain-containing protein n=1 Tax=Syphacia muris TaxID=451379 RepID=A0A0N5B0N0_9BILA
MDHQLLSDKNATADTSKCDLLSKAKGLMEERDKLDAIIKEQQDILRLNGTGISGSLVDDDGYPLSDIDIYAVRHARNSIICAQNDWKTLTKEIENLMHQIHEKTRRECGDTFSSVEKHEVHRTSNYAFALIEKVQPRSPAEAAVCFYYCVCVVRRNFLTYAFKGIVNGDKVIQFGSVHAVASVFDLMAFQVPLKVTVIRNDKPLRLEVTPRKWPGLGLLGCSFLPLPLPP